MKLGKYYNQTARDIKIEKVEPVSNNPQPEELGDVTSGTVNEILTPGRAAVLTGLRLKFNVDDREQGIFFVAADNTVARVSKIITLTNSQVIFIIPPELVAGEYTLEVRVLPKGNKTVKKGLLKDKLTV